MTTTYLPDLPKLKELISKARTNITSTKFHDDYFIPNNILVQELIEILGCPTEEIKSDNLLITRMSKPGYWNYVFSSNGFMLTVQALWNRSGQLVRYGKSNKETHITYIKPISAKKAVFDWLMLNLETVSD